LTGSNEFERHDVSPLVARQNNVWRIAGRHRNLFAARPRGILISASALRHTNRGLRAREDGP
jgi:hypothetical protein